MKLSKRDERLRDRIIANGGRMSRRQGHSCPAVSLEPVTPGMYDYIDGIARIIVNDPGITTFITYHDTWTCPNIHVDQVYYPEGRKNRRERRELERRVVRIARAIDNDPLGTVLVSREGHAHEYGSIETCPDDQFD